MSKHPQQQSAALKWPPREPGKKLVLHLINANSKLPKSFDPAQWQEVTASKEMESADVPLDICGLAAVADESCDAIWNVASLCYLQAHEVVPVLKECFRILRPSGSLMLNLPDLQRVGQSLAQGKLEHELYRSPAGPITAIDLLFGHRASLRDGYQHLQVRTGFVAGTIVHKLTPLGFGEVEVTREGWLLHVVARKIPASPPDKPLIRIHEEDLNKTMQLRDKIEKNPEFMKITPENAFDEPSKL